MTIKDIARLSGCGVATVSRVLNNHPDVSGETRQRVLAVVEENGFQPNNNAKRLKQQAGNSVLILVKDTQNMLFGLVERLQALLGENDQDASVHYLDEDGDEVGYALRLCRERKPPGILFLGGDLDRFRQGFGAITVPCVLLTNTAQGLGFGNLSSLTTDDRVAAAQVIGFLAEKGHRHIGVLGGNWACSQISYRRLLGCRERMEQLGLPFEETQCEPCRYSMADAYEAARRLLGRCPELTAIFAMSDVMATGAIRAIRDLGRRVPEDVSVVGYDGVPISDYLVPRLATVRQDTQLLAQRGVELLLRSIRRPDSSPVHDVVSFRLIPGESVADLT